jgi:DNA-binding LytR/AlgR family response regulator
MPDKITVLIVEDDPIISADLTYLMRDFGYSPFPPLKNADDTLMMLENITPDFILMDVSLEGDVDGIDLATEINKIKSIPIIFLTAHHDRATIDRIKATQPSAYLVKPLQEFNLQTSIELALYNYSHQKLQNKEDDSFDSDFISGDHFFIKVKNQLKKVLLSEILFFEASDNYSFLHTAKQKYIISSTLKTLESKLKDFDFVRIHRSSLINLLALEGIEEDVAIIAGNNLPVGKTYKVDLMKRIKLL